MKIKFLKKYNRIDPILLTSLKGLEKLPIEIQKQTSDIIAQYLVDLSRSPSSIVSLYRSKLMVVGYEQVGKTTLLDCLYPLSSMLTIREGFIKSKKEYNFELRGKFLRQYQGEKLIDQIEIEDKEWKFTLPSKDKKQPSLTLEKVVEPKKKLKFYFESSALCDIWVERLGRILRNSATHGIDVSRRSVEHEVLTNIFPNDKFELSIWDFAGQSDYYNNHHYFLSTRTVFLVVWKMSDGEKGLEGLDFWLKNLATHLPKNEKIVDGNSNYSIIIVGTFLDHESVIKEECTKREEKAISFGVSHGFNRQELHYIEVSCATLENTETLQSAIYALASSHSYMGEKIPEKYLVVEKAMAQLLREKKAETEISNQIPVVNLEELLGAIQHKIDFSIALLKRALNLFHNWGKCIYFESPDSLSNIVVLDPKFLTKEILAGLFKVDPILQKKRENGIIKYSDLSLFWPNYVSLAPILLTLLENFEVCFRVIPSIESTEPIGESNSPSNDSPPPPPSLKMRGRATSNFTGTLQTVNENSLIFIPNLFPEEITDEIQEKLQNHWPSELLTGVTQIERLFEFDILPSELASRLIVRLHKLILDSTCWRRGVLLKGFFGVVAYLRVFLNGNKIEVRLRGKSREPCIKLLTYLVTQIQIATKSYPGIKFYQAIQSPHSNASIRLTEIQEFESESVNEISCPSTGLPIKIKDLLIKTGLQDFEPES